ncbi:MAG: cation transporter [Clostridiales bacterium]|nr:cation transporter [Clostridiales bacterium]
MTALLIRLFIKKPEEVRDPAIRYAYGRLAGASGLCANLLLFILKLLAGFLSGSMAVVADAFNNLSDAGSSIVTLVGFKLSSLPPDREHPFGHGRMEYLAALGVAALIMAAGFELATSSFDKILHPTPTSFSFLTVIILLISIGVKLWMALFYRKIGLLIDSETLKAATADSRNDVICTGVVLLSSVFVLFSGIEIDGYIGVAVALFVIWSGFSIVKEAVSPLLGQAPDKEMVEDIKKTVLENEGIVGVHDLMVHNYGPGRMVISLHAEVPCREDMMRSHDLIDRVEKELMQKFHAMTCIHMDPVDTEDERVQHLHVLVEEVLRDIDPTLSLHDFRVVFGETHTNLIFDVVIPYDFKETQNLCSDIQRRVWERDETLFTVATVEHSFTPNE